MKLKEKLRLALIAFILSFACHFQFGFSSTYLNSPARVFKAFLNESLERREFHMDENLYVWIWSLICNIWFVGFFFGIWLSPLLNDGMGRKAGFLIASLFSFVAAVLRYVSIVWCWAELLFFGRLLASICTAVTYQSLILFLQECSPTKHRGFFTFASEITYAGMTLLGMFLGMEFVWGKDLAKLLGFAIVPCIISVLVLLPMHETPKFLYIAKKNKSAALKSIHFYQGASADAEVILLEIAQEAEATMEKSSSLREILHTPHLRKAVLLSCLALQNTVALWSILLSSTDFLKRIALDDNYAEWSSTGMTFCYLAGTILGATSIERIGRRKMVLTFGAANTVLLLIYVILSELQPVIGGLRYGCLLCLLLYGFTYGFGVGPISWFLSAELVPQRHRSLVQSTCYAINTVMVVVTTFTVLPLFTVIRAYSFLFLYIIPSTLGLVVLYLQLPETKGREIHDIVAELKGESPKAFGGKDNFTSC